MHEFVGDCIDYDLKFFALITISSYLFSFGKSSEFSVSASSDGWLISNEAHRRLLVHSFGGGWRRVEEGAGGWRRVEEGGGGWRRVEEGGGG